MITIEDIEKAFNIDRRPFKDPNLKGLYVKRCKCGARPYFDRISAPPFPKWIACNCGKTGRSDVDKQKAIDNWNNNILEY